MKRTDRRIVATVALAASSLGATGAVVADGIGTATAPEPARLDDHLTSSWEHAHYVESRTPTYGFLASKDWFYHDWMWQYAGYGCINVNAPAGTTLPGYLVASGNWVRCTGW